MGDTVAQAILAAVKRGANSGVTFSADALVMALRSDFRWTDPQIADLLRCVRRQGAKGTKT